jgi:single-strand DNA-binding protein
VLGNCGKDPEVRYMPNGDAACNVSIATSRSWKDKNSGERQEETEWHRVSFFGKTAEIAGKFLTKGKSCYVEGRLKTRKWADKDGVEKYTTEIIADSLVLLGGGSGEPEQRQERQAPAGKSGGAPKKSSYDDLDSEIPF